MNFKKAIYVFAITFSSIALAKPDGGLHRLAAYSQLSSEEQQVMQTIYSAAPEKGQELFVEQYKNSTVEELQQIVVQMQEMIKEQHRQEEYQKIEAKQNHFIDLHNKVQWGYAAAFAELRDKFSLRCAAILGWSTLAFADFDKMIEHFPQSVKPYAQWLARNHGRYLFLLPIAYESFIALGNAVNYVVTWRNLLSDRNEYESLKRSFERSGKSN